MSLRAHVALLALLVTASPVAGAVGPGSASTMPRDQPASGADAGAAETVSATAIEPAETTFVIELEPDGDARWTVRMNFSLATQKRRAAFDSFAAEFENGAELQTLTAVRQASREASAATDREMAITDVERDAVTYNDTGQLRLRFTWTNFGRQANSSLHVDDAFDTTDGTWFRSLGPNQALVVEPPEGYALSDATPAGYQVSAGSLRWEGEREFDEGGLSITYRDVDGPGPDQREVEWMLAALLLVGSVAAGVYFFRRRDGGFPSLPTASNESTNGTDPDATGAPTNGDPTTDTGVEDTDGSDGGTDAVDEALLSDEERVERLLERNGGRMKQANIVTETGWSNAKVSQLLSSMDEDGRIDKLRIGRENLISFPDEDVTDIDREDE